MRCSPLIAVSILALAWPAHAASLNIAPSDTTLNWSFMPHRRACTQPICDLLTNKLMAQRTQRPNICHLFDPARSSEFTFPVWHTQDYRPRLDQIKFGVIRAFFGNEPLTQTLRRKYPSEDLAHIRERIWARYRAEILALFARGSAIYQTANFDVDGDQAPEKLYRISYVEPIRSDKDFVWRVRACDTTGHQPQFNVHLDSAANIVPGSYLEQLSKKLDDVSLSDYFQFRKVSYRFSGSENGGSVSDIWTNRRRKYVFEGVRWGGLLNYSRTQPYADNVVWTGRRSDVSVQ